MTTFGARLKMLRGDKNGETFSALLGVNLQTLYRYERDERVPDLGFIQQLLRVTGASAAWTVLGEGEAFAAGSYQSPALPAEQTSDRECADGGCSFQSELLLQLSGMEQRIGLRLTELEKALTRSGSGTE